MSKVPIPKLLEKLQEGKLYDIQLTVCEDGKDIKVINGQVLKKKNSQPVFTIDDGYSSEGEILERDTYTYIFLKNNGKVGTLVHDSRGRNLYLKLMSSGRRIRVGCSISISNAMNLLF